MNEHIQQTLEFDKVIIQLNNQAATTAGKELTRKLKPSEDIEMVKQWQAETDEAGQLIRLNMSVPLGGIADIRASVKRSVIGGILTAEDCHHVSTTLYATRQVKHFFDTLEMDVPHLKDMAARILSLPELERAINNCIDDRGNVMDSATSKLRSIRSSIRSYEGNVRDKLDSYTKSQSKMLSDTIVTIRNDRYVLPVKQEYRGTIGGIVHDQSTSGATLFMEPQAIVDMNNHIQEAKSKEKQEVDRILQDLSGQIAANETVLTENVSLLAQIDFINARAKLGRQMNAAMPVMNKDGVINLEDARHPLIPEGEVVSNDVTIGDDYTTIVITGPNTGGKTVTLKMVGLFTLMAQSGLQIPAEDGCQMAVFDNVFADIGDEQSIEQSLSTFSSHMTNIVSILQRVDHQSLVLFDELGAGTDPQEGAALAMAILDDVVARGARTVATTHYPELKAYSYNRDHVVNASVEFNVETLKPTYRLLIGVPGRSNAFDIAKRLGLSDSVIDDAKNHVGVKATSVESMIASLEQSHHEAEADYDQAHEILNESEKLHTELRKAWNQFEQQRETLYKNAEDKAARALQKARDEAGTIVEEVRNMKTDAQLKEHEWIEARKMLEEAQPDLSKKRSNKAASPSPSQQELKPGDQIKLLSANQQGSVLEKVNNREYLVQVGIMKVKVKRDDLQRISEQKTATEKPLTTVKGSGHHVKTELDLRGERYEEAMAQLEKYVDDALLAGYPKVFIIHGKGTGALRKGVKQFAEKNPRVKGNRQGEAGEGGSGVTVLALA